MIVTLLKIVGLFFIITITYMCGFNKGYSSGFDWATKQEQDICEKELKAAQESNRCTYRKK